MEGTRRSQGKILPHKRRLIFILGMLSAFGPMSIDMYLPSLPTLTRFFSTSHLTVQLTLASFFVGISLGQLFFGTLSDRFGRKGPLLLGLMLYVLSSAGCALAPSIGMLVALRFVQGLGACAGIVISRAVVRDLFPPREAPHIFAAMILVMGLAPIVAPLVGGYLLVCLGWQSIFWLLTVFGIGILCLVYLGLTESHVPTAEHSLEIKTVLRRYHALLLDKRFMAFSLVYAMCYGGMFAYIAGSPFVFIDLYRVPASSFGWIFGANALGLVLMAQFNRILHRRYTAEGILQTIVSVQGLAALLLLVSALNSGISMIAIILPLFVYVAGIGLVGPNVTALAMASQSRHAGSASALLGAMQFTAASFSAIVIGSLTIHSALALGITIFGCASIAGIALLYARTLPEPILRTKN
ncbi:hypothetical protein B1757_06135 [Acidithiobacillus marinus]|uniref:Bcr/CflA family efflux transporter n=1 Tax=Acidithiobacillus marinus TaxID=187490 RepID=A0A2I1DMG6_9PROT|nr:multidrug effflux MFS transporter [Acidithiobacillus marinus]PKY11071.1 hypothetical protein B1757_06135 [Acidithiobacillus marinus]